MQGGSESVNMRACEDPLENHKNANCLYHAMWQEDVVDDVLGRMMWKTENGTETGTGTGMGIVTGETLAL